MSLKQARVQLLQEDEGGGAIPAEDVDVLTSASAVSFNDGENLQEKVDTGKLASAEQINELKETLGGKLTLDNFELIELTGTKESPVYLSELELNKFYKFDEYIQNSAEQGSPWRVGSDIPYLLVEINNKRYLLGLNGSLLYYDSFREEFRTELDKTLDGLSAQLSLNTCHDLVLEDDIDSIMNLYNGLTRARKTTRKKEDAQISTVYASDSYIAPLSLYDPDWNPKDVCKFLVIPYKGVENSSSGVVKAPYIATYDRTQDIDTTHPTYPWNSVDFLATESQISEAVNLKNYMDPLIEKLITVKLNDVVMTGATVSDNLSLYFNSNEDYFNLCGEFNIIFEESKDFSKGDYLDIIIKLNCELHMSPNIILTGMLKFRESCISIISGSVMVVTVHFLEAKSTDNLRLSVNGVSSY